MVHFMGASPVVSGESRPSVRRIKSHFRDVGRAAVAAEVACGAGIEVAAASGLSASG